MISRGFDGVRRGCASQSEKQRSGANQSESGGGGATGCERSLRSFRAARLCGRKLTDSIGSLPLADVKRGLYTTENPPFSRL